MSTISKREAIRRFQAREHIVLRWLLAPGLAIVGLLFCSVVLAWPRWLAYGLFIVLACILVAILAMRQCPFCGKTVSLGLDTGWRARFERCPHCSNSLYEPPAG